MGYLLPTWKDLAKIWMGWKKTQSKVDLRVVKENGGIKATPLCNPRPTPLRQTQPPDNKRFTQWTAVFKSIHIFGIVLARICRP